MDANVKSLVSACIELFIDFLKLVGVEDDVITEIEETLNSFNK